MLILTAGCDDKFRIGGNILPSDDYSNMQMTDTFDIVMYTEKAYKVRTDNPSYLFLGSYSDLVFGTSSAGFITQVLQASYPPFGDTAILDSICLVLPLGEEDYSYGGIDARLNLSVYEVVKDTLKTPFYYYSDENPADYTEFDRLGRGVTNHRHILYTDDEGVEHDTLALSLRLDDEFGQHLIDSSDYYFYAYGKFSDVFKGIYVVENEDSQIGNKDESCIYKILNTVSSTTSNFGIVVYYHFPSDKTTKKYALPINASAAQFNMFSHDYSETNFADQIANPGTIVDSVAYLQSMAGTSIRVEIPGLKNFNDVVINKAELIIENAPTDFYGDYDPLEQMWLCGFDTDSNIVYFPDFMGNTYEGASIDDDNEYHFYVTRIVQDIIAGVYENREVGIYMTNLNAGIDFKRSVITTGRNTNPSKIVVTYMKYK